MIENIEHITSLVSKDMFQDNVKLVACKCQLLINFKNSLDPECWACSGSKLFDTIRVNHSSAK